MKITPTRDEAFIRECITHPRIWPSVSCDGVGKDQIGLAEHLIYLCPEDDIGRLGVFVLEPHNPRWLEVHTALLPNAWGPRAAEGARAAIEYVRAAGIRKLTTLVPDGNFLALRFAKKAGFREEGRISKSYPHEGKMMDQVLLGMELCQQQQQ
jgi:RimJ/RimL family protein N-acetyltransferase